MLALALLLCQYRSALAYSNGHHSILVVYSLSRSIEINPKFLSGLTAAFEPFDLDTCEILHENLDLDQIENSENLDSLAAFINTKYASKKFDAILTVNDWALDFLLTRCNSLSPGATLIAVVGSRKEYPSQVSGRKIITLPVVWESEGTIDLILHLQPTVKKVYIVSGVHPLERSFRDYFRNNLRQLKDGPEFVFLTESRYDELLSTAKGFATDNAIIFLSFLRDGWGRSYSSKSVACRLSEVAGCPMYGIGDTFMGCGIVGGSMISFYREGLVAGRILLGLFGMKNGAPEPNEIGLLPLKQVDEEMADGQMESF